ncbi:hypothetical protein BN1263500015 [Stenotrophomonas indicatrix]|nr:hypothetical protein BN1263500015 [Stenotrophomonas indicatrix]
MDPAAGPEDVPQFTGEGGDHARAGGQPGPVQRLPGGGHRGGAGAGAAGAGDVLAGVRGGGGVLWRLQREPAHLHDPGGAGDPGVGVSRTGVISGQRHSPSWVGRVELSWGWSGGLGSRGTPQVRPCRLGRGIHAADTPANPTRPTPDRFRARPAHGEEKKIKSNSGSLRSWVLRA